MMRQISGLSCVFVALFFVLSVIYEFDNHIVIDARYNIGVTKVFEGSTNHNSVLLATVGYKFRL